VTSMTDGQPGIAAVAGSSAFDALAGRHVAIRLAAAAARVGNAAALAFEIGGARRSRRRAIAVGDALNALAPTSRADGSALCAVAIVHARHAYLALGLAQRAIGPGAIGIGNAADASAAGGITLHSLFAGDRAARPARGVARVIGRRAGADRSGTIVVAGAYGASSAHAPRLGGGAAFVVAAFHAAERGVTHQR
jgi:hypothetical protein